MHYGALIIFTDITGDHGALPAGNATKDYVWPIRVEIFDIDNIKSEIEINVKVCVEFLPVNTLRAFCYTNALPEYSRIHFRLKSFYDFKYNWSSFLNGQSVISQCCIE